MTFDWQSLASQIHLAPELVIEAASRLQDGWSEYYLAHCPPGDGGGLSLEQLRQVARELAQQRQPAWLRQREQDRSDAACWQAFLQRLPALGQWDHSDREALRAQLQDQLLGEPWYRVAATTLLARGRVMLPTAPATSKRSAGPTHARQEKVAAAPGKPQRPTRLAPRQILEAAQMPSCGEQLQWDFDLPALAEDLVRRLPSSKRSSRIELKHALCDAWLAGQRMIECCAWGRLQKQAAETVAEWARRSVGCLLRTRPLMSPVLSLSPGPGGGCQAVSVDGTGAAAAASEFSLGNTDTMARQIADLLSACPAPILAVSATAGCDRVVRAADALVAGGAALQWTIVDVRGAAWWAGSMSGRESAPQLSQAAREALFIGRRLQDPLATLCDVPAIELAPCELRPLLPGDTHHVLEREADDCLHELGLNVNRAGFHALARLCGVTPLQARRAAARRPPGGWTSSDDLRAALGATDRQWQQTAPFVRVADPEARADYRTEVRLHGRQIRLQDLRVGQVLPGVVRRTATFGVFVDVGAAPEGLLHVSQLAPGFVVDPMQDSRIAPGAVLQVQVTEVDQARGRITLSLDAPESAAGREGGPGTRRRRGADKPASSPKAAQPSPISEEMARGQEPLRSFSDLAQFYESQRRNQEKPE